MPDLLDIEHRLLMSAYKLPAFLSNPWNVVAVVGIALGGMLIGMAVTSRHHDNTCPVIAAQIADDLGSQQKAGRENAIA